MTGVVDFTCRLPFVRTANQTTQPGFLEFPSGTFVADSSATVTTRGGGLAYDRVVSRWLPVDWRYVSDDGLHYTYVLYSADVPSPGQTSTIHVVDVLSGRDRVVLATGQYSIVDYTGGTIYLTSWIGGHDGPGPQVAWALDPASGALRALSGGARYGYWISSGAGWRTDYNPADPTVHQGMTGPNRLIRVDLATGAESTWFYQQGADGVQVLGFDRQGAPVVAEILGSTWTIWLLHSADSRTKLFSDSNTFWASATADSHGIWLSGSAGVELYDVTNGARRVSSESGAIAGGCH